MSGGITGLLLPLALAAPLCVALLGLSRRMRPHMLPLLPVAPLPGLLAALLAPREAVFLAPDFVLGVRLSLHGEGAMFLGMASFLWIAAGFYAVGYMREAAATGRFAAFWCLTLAGNLGVFIAADISTFYVAFACVSLAAYPLIVHDGSSGALGAGRVYIVLAVLGETCLLLGFMLAATGAGSMIIAEIRQSLPGSAHRDWTIVLLILGFGIKAGLVPLHVWLPLAHPAAPTPASAVLSGAIVKAGIFGLIQFLPGSVGLAVWSDLIVGAGLLTAYFGIAVGLAQSNPKTILAYSTISQMGIVVAVIGTALGPDPAPGTLAAASFYALHHGLAKGALFLGVGVVAASGTRILRPVMIVMAVVGLAVAGLPLTGGALTKLAIKDSFAPLPLHLVTLTAVGTALLVTRFLIVVRRKTAEEPDKRPAAGLLWPWASTAVAATALPWLLFSGVTGEAVYYPLKPVNLWSAAWPLLLASFIALLATRAAVIKAPHIPEGDLLIPAAAGLRAVVREAATFPPIRLRVAAHWKRLAVVGEWLTGAETAFARWRVAGLALLLLTLASALAGCAPP